MKRAIWNVFVRCCLIGSAILPGEAFGYDSEWPPAPDPVSAGISPAPGLQMGTIAIDIPAPYSAWLQHMHMVPWGTTPYYFAIGDVEGADDGDLDMVIYLSEELLLAGRLTINWAQNTGTFTPLWGWKTPVCPANPPVDAVSCSFHSPARNVLIWDFDADGTNEVAIVAPNYDYTTSNLKRAIYLFQTDPASTDYVPGWNVPKPILLTKSAAESYTNPDTGLMGERLGLCKVRDTPHRQDIIAHNHNGITWSVWSPVKNPAGWTITQSYQHGYDSGSMTHEFNYVDVDGDGYDEFMHDGVHDFVDKVNGVATPLNGVWGINRWKTGSNFNHPNDHSDMTICADFNSSHPGLEIMTTPGVEWTDRFGVYHPEGHSVLWDVNGNILDEAAGPYFHPQSIFVGNFVPDNVTPGLETIHVAKSCWSGVDYKNTVNASDWHGDVSGWYLGSYAEDQSLNNMVVDGCYWFGASYLTVGSTKYWPARSSGPSCGVTAMDWDGDHASDEIFNPSFNCDFVWRMGKKGDWGANPPAGMPSATQVLQGWTENVGGANLSLHWEYYQKYDGSRAANADPNLNWGWNNGGAGRWTHYYEKLGETFNGGLAISRPYDVGKDYREEIVRLRINYPLSQIVINYNTAPLADPDKYVSPATLLDYRSCRQDMNPLPFDYASVPLAPPIPVAAFSVSPASGAAPLTVSFTDGSSKSPTSWAWDFECDGTIDSASQSPQHTYNAAGIYSVKLTVANDNGSDFEFKRNYISVTPHVFTASRSWILFE